MKRKEILKEKREEKINMTSVTRLVSLTLTFLRWFLKFPNIMEDTL